MQVAEQASARSDLVQMGAASGNWALVRSRLQAAVGEKEPPPNASQSD
jgi:hypothetical protein